MGCDIHSIGQVKMGDEWVTQEHSILDDPRSYDTFAQLANVRNGYGFAGVPTGEGFEPISEPRGLPKDLETDSDNEEYVDGTWLGDHSHSWLLLSELKEYAEKAKSKKTTESGYVPESVYLKLRGTNKWPEGWSGGGWGGNTVYLNSNAYDISEQLGELSDYDGKEICVQYSWEIGYLDTGNLPKIIEELEKLGKEYAAKDDEVRFVFGFDS